ncbi:hypothetical protein BESB_007420 [Besnoitia besnoiti]|uniref:Uncharacterized protein n=1 Tax=Besnoitia besnoiti TaxID=94643 RepID=A0A2A9MQN1_BESBE|nr:hypothetical protein BESB_007420 [Besnoitia besnoiti]PFH38400.1 hypothetical protein BESB_007420 [Besnoitia besnoiti]
MSSGLASCGVRTAEGAGNPSGVRIATAEERQLFPATFLNGTGSSLGMVAAGLKNAGHGGYAVAPSAAAATYVPQSLSSLPTQACMVLAGCQDMSGMSTPLNATDMISPSSCSTSCTASPDASPSAATSSSGAGVNASFSAAATTGCAASVAGAGKSSAQTSLRTASLPQPSVLRASAGLVTPVTSTADLLSSLSSHKDPWLHLLLAGSATSPSRADVVAALKTNGGKSLGLGGASPLSSSKKEDGTPSAFSSVAPVGGRMPLSLPLVGSNCVSVHPEIARSGSLTCESPAAAGMDANSATHAAALANLLQAQGVGFDKAATDSREEDAAMLFLQQFPKQQLASHGGAVAPGQQGHAGTLTLAAQLAGLVSGPVSPAPRLWPYAGRQPVQPQRLSRADASHVEGPPARRASAACGPSPPAATGRVVQTGTVKRANSGLGRTLAAAAAEDAAKFAPSSRAANAEGANDAAGAGEKPRTVFIGNNKASYHPDKQEWRTRYYQDGRRCMRTYSAKYYGYERAKCLAECFIRFVQTHGALPSQQTLLLAAERAQQQQTLTQLANDAVAPAAAGAASPSNKSAADVGFSRAPAAGAEAAGSCPAAAAQGLSEPQGVDAFLSPFAGNGLAHSVATASAKDSVLGSEPSSPTATSESASFRASARSRPVSTSHSGKGAKGERQVEVKGVNGGVASPGRTDDVRSRRAGLKRRRESVAGAEEGSGVTTSCRHSATGADSRLVSKLPTNKAPKRADGVDARISKHIDQQRLLKRNTTSDVRSLVSSAALAPSVEARANSEMQTQGLAEDEAALSPLSDVSKQLPLALLRQLFPASSSADSASESCLAHTSDDPKQSASSSAALAPSGFSTPLSSFASTASAAADALALAVASAGKECARWNEGTPGGNCSPDGGAGETMRLGRVEAGREAPFVETACKEDSEEDVVGDGAFRPVGVGGDSTDRPGGVQKVLLQGAAEGGEEQGLPRTEDSQFLPKNADVALVESSMDDDRTASLLQAFFDGCVLESLQRGRAHPGGEGLAEAASDWKAEDYGRRLEARRATRPQPGLVSALGDTEGKDRERGDTRKCGGEIQGLPSSLSSRGSFSITSASTAELYPSAAAGLPVYASVSSLSLSDPRLMQLLADRAALHSQAGGRGRSDGFRHLSVPLADEKMARLLSMEDKEGVVVGEKNTLPAPYSDTTPHARGSRPAEGVLRDQKAVGSLPDDPRGREGVSRGSGCDALLLRSVLQQSRACARTRGCISAEVLASLSRSVGTAGDDPGGKREKIASVFQQGEKLLGLHDASLRTVSTLPSAVLCAVSDLLSVFVLGEQQAEKNERSGKQETLESDEDQSGSAGSSGPAPQSAEEEMTTVGGGESVKRATCEEAMSGTKRERPERDFTLKLSCPESLADRLLNSHVASLCRLACATEAPLLSAFSSVFSDVGGVLEGDAQDGVSTPASFLPLRVDSVSSRESLNPARPRDAASQALSSIQSLSIRTLRAATEASQGAVAAAAAAEKEEACRRAKSDAASRDCVVTAGVAERAQCVGVSAEGASREAHATGAAACHAAESRLPHEAASEPEKPGNESLSSDAAAGGGEFGSPSPAEADDSSCSTSDGSTMSDTAAPIRVPCGGASAGSESAGFGVKSEESTASAETGTRRELLLPVASAEQSPVQTVAEASGAERGNVKAACVSRFRVLQREQEDRARRLLKEFWTIQHLQNEVKEAVGKEMEEHARLRERDEATVRVGTVAALAQQLFRDNIELFLLLHAALKAEGRASSAEAQGIKRRAQLVEQGTQGNRGSCEGKGGLSVKNSEGSVAAGGEISREEEEGDATPQLAALSSPTSDSSPSAAPCSSASSCSQESSVEPAASTVVCVSALDVARERTGAEQPEAQQGWLQHKELDGDVGRGKGGKGTLFSGSSCSIPRDVSERGGASVDSSVSDALCALQRTVQSLSARQGQIAELAKTCLSLIALQRRVLAERQSLLAVTIEALGLAGDHGGVSRLQCDGGNGSSDHEIAEDGKAGCCSAASGVDINQSGREAAADLCGRSKSFAEKAGSRAENSAEGGIRTFGDDNASACSSKVCGVGDSDEEQFAVAAKSDEEGVGAAEAPCPSVSTAREGTLFSEDERKSSTPEIGVRASDKSSSAADILRFLSSDCGAVGVDKAHAEKAQLRALSGVMYYQPAFAGVEMKGERTSDLASGTAGCGTEPAGGPSHGLVTTEVPPEPAKMAESQKVGFLGLGELLGSSAVWERMRRTPQANSPSCPSSEALPQGAAAAFSGPLSDVGRSDSACAVMSDSASHLHRINWQVPEQLQDEAAGMKRPFAFSNTALSRSSSGLGGGQDESARKETEAFLLSLQTENVPSMPEISTFLHLKGDGSPTDTLGDRASLAGGPPSRPSRS